MTICLAMMQMFDLEKIQAKAPLIRKTHLMQDGDVLN